MADIDIRITGKWAKQKYIYTGILTYQCKNIRKMSKNHVQCGLANAVQYYSHHYL